MSVRLAPFPYWLVGWLVRGGSTNGEQLSSLCGRIRGNAEEKGPVMWDDSSFAEAEANEELHNSLRSMKVKEGAWMCGWVCSG